MQRTALYLACEEGHAQCVDVLLKGGAKVTYFIPGDHEEQNSSEVDDYQKYIKSCLGIAILRQNRFIIINQVYLSLNEGSRRYRWVDHVQWRSQGEAW